MWNKDGELGGYDFQKEELGAATIRFNPKPLPPQTLSRKNVEKIERVVKQIERDDKNK